MIKRPENYIVISTYFDKEGKEITWSSTHEIRNLEDRIGLNPKARVQLGIQLVSAKKSLSDLNSELDLED